jgi:cytochrome c
VIRAGLSVLLLAVGAPVVVSPPPRQPADAPPAFARCATCHAASKDAAHGLGNNLFGIYGKRAGSMPDYAYSDAMIGSRIVWTSARLDAFIADPRAVVPGTKMSSAKLADPARRAEIIRYLKSLR